MRTKAIKILKILKKEVKKFKNPIATEISQTSKDPFKVLISCLLSTRTRDETTAKVSRGLFKIANTPKKLAKINIKKLQKIIKPIGFYKVKAKRIKQISTILIKDYKSKVPESLDELLKLPGVGRKCAGIVMSYGHYKVTSIPIDTHAHRLPNRIGIIKTKTPEKTEQTLMKIYPKKYWYDINNTFVAFGQNICKPIKPLCFKCPIVKYCKYKNKNLE